MKKNMSVILIICVVVALIWGIREYNVPKLEVEYNENVKINEPVIFNIKTKQYNRYITLKNIRLTLQHKYNKDEAIDKKLISYKAGNYQLIYYPVDPGEYSGILSIKMGNELITQNLQVEVN